MATEKLLLLEDDAALGRSLKISLELEGYQVEWARDVRTAEGLAPTRDFDLMLFDWNLPDGTGLELCRRLREDAKLATPILFLTARTDEESAIAALESGAQDFVRKPFGPRELVARIRAALRQNAEREAELRFGELRALPRERRAFFGDEEIDLNRREFDVLCVLLRRADAVVTREELLESIDREGNLFDRTIDSHVSHLRARLKKAEVHGVQIASVYGVGYRLEKVEA